MQLSTRAIICRCPYFTKHKRINCPFSKEDKNFGYRSLSNSKNVNNVSNKIQYYTTFYTNNSSEDRQCHSVILYIQPQPVSFQNKAKLPKPFRIQSYVLHGYWLYSTVYCKHTPRNWIYGVCDYAKSAGQILTFEALLEAYQNSVFKG